MLRKYMRLILILFSSCLSLLSQELLQTYLIKDGNRYTTIIDRQGNVIVSYKEYEYIHYYGNYIGVKEDETLKEIFFLDANREMFPKVKHQHFLNWSNNVAYFKKGDLYGVMNKKGKILFEPQFEFVKVASFGHMIVTKNGYDGLIDTLGNIVIPFNIDKKSLYGAGIHNGKPIYSIVSDKSYETFIDLNGKERFSIPKSVGKIYNFTNEDITIYEKDSKYGYIDITGKVITPPKFEWAYPFRNGFAVVRSEYGRFGSDAYYGVIDSTGKYVIEPNLYNAFISDYSSDYFVLQRREVIKQDDWQRMYFHSYLVNKKGERVKEFKNTKMYGFHNGLARMVININPDFDPLTAKGSQVTEKEYFVTPQLEKKFEVKGAVQVGDFKSNYYGPYESSNIAEVSIYGPEGEGVYYTYIDTAGKILYIPEEYKHFLPEYRTTSSSVWYSSPYLYIIGGLLFGLVYARKRKQTA